MLDRRESEKIDEFLQDPPEYPYLFFKIIE